MIYSHLSGINAGKFKTESNGAKENHVAEAKASKGQQYAVMMTYLCQFPCFDVEATRAKVIKTFEKRLGSRNSIYLRKV